MAIFISSFQYILYSVPSLYQFDYLNYTQLIKEHDQPDKLADNLLDCAAHTTTTTYILPNMSVCHAHVFD